MIKTIYNFVKPFLPGVILMYASELRNKDTNRTGADDLAADLAEALAPLASGDFGNGPLALKIARQIENSAHAYRMAVGDVGAVSSSDVVTK